MSDLLDVIKQAGFGAVHSAYPAEIRFGLVVSVDPLSIKLDQKLTLSEAFLTLTDAVKDLTVDITIDGLTDSSGDTVAGRTSATIHKALKVGDAVVMLRMQGGQKFVVLDKSA